VATNVSGLSLPLAEPPSSSGRVLRVVRDSAAPVAECPECGARIALGIEGARWTLRSPSDVADRLMVQLGSLDREELHVLALDAKNHVLSQSRVYVGNVSSSVVRVGELFRDAVRIFAPRIVVAHNHPSGDPTPSPDDLHLTAEAIAAGRLLDIDLLDHLVICRDSFVSLRDRGVSFDRPNRS
jgi:DNA repair protein RadC